MDTESQKRAAAVRALEGVESGMILGLGTGSTVTHLLEALGEALRSGRLRDIQGVPTSLRTEEDAARLGIPLTDLVRHPRLDLTLDGADEVDPALNAVKGLGGALLREKMVAQASARLVLMVDESKRVPRLGSRAPLPVEVVPFQWESHLPFLRELGAEGRLRTDLEGAPYVTDNGNFILDAHFPQGISDPARVEAAAQGRAGIVETGLFMGMADQVVVAGPDGTLTLGRDHD